MNLKAIWDMEVKLKTQCSTPMQTKVKFAVHNIKIALTTGFPKLYNTQGWSVKFTARSTPSNTPRKYPTNPYEGLHRLSWHPIF